LAPAQKLLAHWLCYIFDRLQPSARVWESLPIFCELCREYRSDIDSAKLACSFTKASNKKAAVYVAKQARDATGNL
jgi:hypothetical protein